MPTDLSAFPVLLKIPDLVQILRLPKNTIYEAVLAGDTTKVPPPAMVYPYRWRRADIARFIDGADALEQQRARRRRLRLTGASR